MIRTYRAFALAGILCAIATAVPPIHGATYEFSGGGAWHSSSSWNPNEIPGPDDKALFSANNNGVLINAPAVAGEIQIGPPLLEFSATTTRISAESNLLVMNSVIVNGLLSVRRGRLRPEGAIPEEPIGRIDLGFEGVSESQVIIANQGRLFVGNFEEATDTSEFGADGARRILGVPRLLSVSPMSLQGDEDLGQRPTAILNAAELTISSIESTHGYVALSSDTRRLSLTEDQSLLAGGHFSESIHVGDIDATDSSIIRIESGFRFHGADLLMTPLFTGAITLHDSTMAVGAATPNVADPQPTPTDAIVGAIELHNSEFVASRGLLTSSITLRGGSRFIGDSVLTQTIDASEGSILEIQAGAGDVTGLGFLVHAL